MATFGDTVPSNGVRKVRARMPAAGGSLRKGNRYTVNTARTVVCAGDMPRSWHGDLPTMPKQGTLDKIANRVISGGYGKRNALCPACGLLRSASNKCDCNS